MIEKVLLDAVASSEAFDDPPDAVLFPQEAAVVSWAVDKRRREFQRYGTAPGVHYANLASPRPRRAPRHSGADSHASGCCRR